MHSHAREHSDMGSVPLMNDPNEEIEQEPTPTEAETLAVLEGEK